MSNVTQTRQSQAPLHEIILSAVDLARICLRMDVAFVSEFRHGRRIFRHIAADGELPVQPGHSDPLAESYCQHVVDGSIPPIVDDSHIYPILKRLGSTEALKIRAHLGVPIWLSDGSVFGTFCCYNRSPSSSLREVDVDALRRFARLIATMLEQRVIAERAAEETCARLAEVMGGRAIAIACQPIVDLSSGGVLGYEALSRFPAPASCPAGWFEDAHRVDKGTELELLAIELALSGLARLPPQAYLSLNVSPCTILSGALASRLGAAPLDRLVLELTEHAPVEEYPAIAGALAGLRRSGLRLAIDDAGSGYASFRHILQLRPDIIKLDQSLVQGIDGDPGRRALAAALTGFARDTGSDVVAEGIETDAELAVLRGLGIKAGQGYLLGRPAPLA
ncbi:EAL domain-containing protein [Massilia sp. BSC265]|uniref:sensor domain-containing phosphodiesterase n=1 Tax=Massilia sp. BSC265 TaxID=1549812 RepID=UPI0004E873DF|nr:EAL domain-containing protein [Massilia sp. BSC265]KFI06518.1 diguanylate phosphodiesterase [Massilia sp. BSC265]